MNATNEIATNMGKILKMAASENLIYTVQSGDIIWSKIKDWKITIKQVQELNPDKNLSIIHPGDRIILPPDAHIGPLTPPKPQKTFVEYPKQTQAVRAVIAQSAQEVGISPKLLTNLIIQESGLRLPGMPGAVDFKARSSAGALGLGQLMPTNIPEGVDPFNPVAGVKSMVAHLVTNKRSSFQKAKILLTQSRFLGKKTYSAKELEEMALYIYNAGMPTVIKSIRAAKATGKVVTFRDYLPAETRTYARSIMSMSTPELKVGTFHVQ